MPQGDQVKNGKAFEYAIAKQYCDYINQQGVKAEIVIDDAYNVAKGYFERFEASVQEKYNNAAYQTIATMLKIEPGLLAQKNSDDTLRICLQNDAEGQRGDVRDIVFSRFNPSWEIGFSAKNNNDAVKHNRLSDTIDFGVKWELGESCSQDYWNCVKPMFAKIRKLKNENPLISWEDIGTETKVEEYYKPLLRAFRDEMMRMNSGQDHLPEKLISYLVGHYPFYKIIKDDSHNMVIVKAFNINGMLNKVVNRIKPQYKTPKILMPTRIIEFDFDPKHPKDTLTMTLDEGWQISFRIHSADNPIVPSFKFDVRLLGNPPILFTQHLFQD